MGILDNANYLRTLERIQVKTYTTDSWLAEQHIERLLRIAEATARAERVSAFVPIYAGQLAASAAHQYSAAQSVVMRARELAEAACAMQDAIIKQAKETP
jgi:hypothetical protein